AAAVGAFAVRGRLDGGDLQPPTAGAEEPDEAVVDCRLIAAEADAHLRAAVRANEAVRPVIREVQGLAAAAGRPGHQEGLTSLAVGCRTMAAVRGGGRSPAPR